MEAECNVSCSEIRDGNWMKAGQTAGEDSQGSGDGEGRNADRAPTAAQRAKNADLAAS